MNNKRRLVIVVVYLTNIIPILLLSLSLLTGCASTSTIVSGTLGSGESDVSVNVDVPIALSQGKRLVTELGVIYVGMPKGELEKFKFTKNTMIDYRNEGSEEWITFSNWITGKPEDVIIFHIKDEKIIDWEEKESVIELDKEKKI